MFGWNFPTFLVLSGESNECHYEIRLNKVSCTMCKLINKHDNNEAAKTKLINEMIAICVS